MNNKDKELREAVVSNDIVKVRSLLNNHLSDINVDMTVGNGAPLLWFAAQRHYYEAAGLLINAGANRHKAIEHGTTPSLHVSNFYAIYMLSKAPPIDPDEDLNLADPTRLANEGTEVEEEEKEEELEMKQENNIASSRSNSRVHSRTGMGLMRKTTTDEDQGIGQITDELFNAIKNENYDKFVELVNRDGCENDSMDSIANKVDDDGSTLLLHAALKSEKAFMALIDKVSPEALSEALVLQNNIGLTALHAAAFSGNRPIKFIALVKKASPEALNKALVLQDNQGWTPLHYAALYQSKDAFMALVNKVSKEALNQALLLPNNKGDTFLHMAASNQSEAAFMALVKKVNPEELSEALNMQGTNGKTPLDCISNIASRKIVEKVIRDLLQDHQEDEIFHGGDSTTDEGPDDLGQIEEKLFNAIKNEDYDEFVELVNSNADAMGGIESIVNSADSDGTTLLMFAIESADTKFFNFLLEKGSDVNAKNKKGMTPLGMAVLVHNPHATNILLQRGVDINAQCNEGWTALMAAVIFKKLAHVKLLVNKGADTELRNQENETVFDLVTSQEIEKLLSGLQSSQSDSVEPNLEEDEKVETSMQVDTSDDFHEDIFNRVSNEEVDDNYFDKLLNNDDFNINYQRLSDGASLLMVAAENNYTRIVETLLNKQIDPSLKDAEERTALDRINNLSPRAKTRIDETIQALIKSCLPNSEDEDFTDDPGVEETKDSEPDSNVTDTRNIEPGKFDPKDLAILLNEEVDTNGTNEQALNEAHVVQTKDYASGFQAQSVNSSYLSRSLLEILVDSDLSKDFSAHALKYLSTYLTGGNKTGNERENASLSDSCMLSCLNESDFGGGQKELKWPSTEEIKDKDFHGWWYSNYVGEQEDYKPTFVMSGRFPDIYVPNYNDSDPSYRTVLVLTRQQYNDFKGCSVIANNRLDVLVIDSLNYIQPLGNTDVNQAELGSISCRRMAIFFMMHQVGFNSCVMMDDNVSELQYSIDNIRQLLRDRTYSNPHYSDLYQTLSKTLSHDKKAPSHDKDNNYHCVSLSGNRSYQTYNNSVPDSFVNHGRVGSKFFFLDAAAIRNEILVGQVRFLCPMVNVFGEDFHMIFFLEKMGLNCGALDRRVFARSRAPEMGSICGQTLAGAEWFHKTQDTFDKMINDMLVGASPNMTKVLVSTIGELRNFSIESLKDIKSKIEAMKQQELVDPECKRRGEFTLSEALLKADDECSQKFLTPGFSQGFANSLSGAIAGGVYNPLIVSPTGSGKSVWISSMLSALYANYSYKDDQSCEDGKVTQFLLCVPTIDLVEESFDRLVGFYPHMDGHVVRSSSLPTHASASEIALNEHLRNKDRSHVVIMCQKSVKNLKNKLTSIGLSLNEIFDVIIVDEAHLATAQLTQTSCSSTSRKISQPLVLGLTATPTAAVYRHYTKVLEITQDQALDARIIRKKKIISLPKAHHDVVAMAASIVVNKFISNNYKAIIFCKTIDQAENVLHLVKQKMRKEENGTEDQHDICNVQSSQNDIFIEDEKETSEMMIEEENVTEDQPVFANVRSTNKCLEVDEEKRGMMDEEENGTEDQADLFLKALHSDVKDNLHDSIINNFKNKQSRAILFLVRMGAVGMNFGVIDAVLDLYQPTNKQTNKQIGFIQRWGRALRTHPLARRLRDCKRILEGNFKNNEIDKICNEIIELHDKSCSHSILKDYPSIYEITEKIKKHASSDLNNENASEYLSDAIDKCIDTLSPPTEIHTFNDDKQTSKIKRPLTDNEEEKNIQPQLKKPRPFGGEKTEEEQEEDHTSSWVYESPGSNK